MNSDRVVLERISQALREVGEVNRAMAMVVLAATSCGDRLDPNQLRELACGCVALGGTITALGVELAADVNECD